MADLLPSAHQLLEQALEQVADDDIDSAIGSVDGALRLLRSAAGLADIDDDVHDLIALATDVDNTPCTCPPELLARGGYRGSCLRHALGSGGGGERG